MGRPKWSTKYEPWMDEAVQEAMAQGLSKLAAAATIGIASDTLYRWINPEDPNFQPSFSAAVMRGNDLSRVFWETAGIRQSTKAMCGSPGAWSLNMRNRFPEEWKDRKEVEHAGNLVVLDDEDDVPEKPAVSPGVKAAVTQAVDEILEDDEDEEDDV